MNNLYSSIVTSTRDFAANDTTLCGARPEHLRGKDIVVAENKEDGTTTYHWDRIFKQ